jgi:hypothetical protein
MDNDRSIPSNPTPVKATKLSNIPTFHHALEIIDLNAIKG